MNTNYHFNATQSYEHATVIGDNRLLRSSFIWMSIAMLLTTLAALLFAAVPELTSTLVNKIDGRNRPSMFAYIIMFSPLLFVLGIRFGLNALSYPALIALFLAFALVNGIGFSMIFLVYELGSITTVFLSTAALYAVMAIAGYTTKTDLTRLGSLLMIGLIGIIIASLINLFMQNSGMDYIISILGVIIFTGLTAYDVQKIKNLGYEMQGSALARKMGIIGALTLYFDFINLFMFLLRLFGNKRE